MVLKFYITLQGIVSFWNKESFADFLYVWDVFIAFCFALQEYLPYAFFLAEIIKSIIWIFYLPSEKEKK